MIVFPVAVSPITAGQLLLRLWTGRAPGSVQDVFDFFPAQTVVGDMPDVPPRVAVVVPLDEIEVEQAAPSRPPTPVGLYANRPGWAIRQDGGPLHAGAENVSGAGNCKVIPVLDTFSAFDNC